MNAMRTTHLCIGIWILISYTHHRFISSVFFFSGATSSYASYPPNDLLHIGFSLSEGAIPTDLRIHASYPSTDRFRRGRKTTLEQPPPPGQLELRLLSSFAGCGKFNLSILDLFCYLKVAADGEQSDVELRWYTSKPTIVGVASDGDKTSQPTVFKGAYDCMSEPTIVANGGRALVIYVS
ncbi:hypothetical protein R6Q59_035784 [Mikania micrantha]